MIRWLTFSVLVLAVQGENCYNDVKDACGVVGSTMSYCNSNYSGVHHVVGNLQQYTTLHLEQNFKYLLMSAFFSNYETNREGFSKLYRKMADDAWEDSLDLVKYLAKRGFRMEFDFISLGDQVKIPSYKMFELESLAKALDMQKTLAEKSHEIHSEASTKSTNHHDTRRNYHDAETIHFIEEKFTKKHAESVRNLAGYTNDLHDLIKAAKEDPSLAIYLFDEHLQKVVA